MAPKPPKKINKPVTPDTDPSVSRPSAEDGTPIPRDSSEGLAGLLPDDFQPALNTAGNSRNQGESESTPRQSDVLVEDIPVTGPAPGQPTETTLGINFLAPPLIASLSAPQVDGLRHGKHRRTYAEIENEGVTLVRRGADGEYRAALPNELEPSGPVLERIAGTDFWRRKNTDDADERPGPSKRARLEEEATDASDTESLVANLPTEDASPLDLSSALWRNWGTSVKPHSGDFVEIDGLYYRIMPRGTARRTNVVYLEHPEFSPSRYDAFEQMLQDNPTLQPRWAVSQDNTWRVVESSLPFQKKLTEHVADTFRDLSDISLTAVARTVFNRANNAEGINALGLMAVHQTFRNWATPAQARPPRQELADPLLMLPIIPRTFRTSNRLALPPPDVGALRRLDFAPDHFPREWGLYIQDPSDYNLRRLVGSVLVRNGYEVFPLTQNHQEPTLVFTRPNHDSVFFLRLERVNSESTRLIAAPGDQLSDPHLASRVGEPAWAALASAYDQDKLVWLLGGPQRHPAGWVSVFLIREG